MTEAMKEATTLLKNSLKATHVNLSSSQFLDPVTSTLLQIPYQQVSRSPSPMSSTIHRGKRLSLQKVLYGRLIRVQSSVQRISFAASDIIQKQWKTT